MSSIERKSERSHLSQEILRRNETDKNWQKFKYT